MREWETLDGGSSGHLGAENAQDEFQREFSTGQNLVEQSRSAGADVVAAAEADYDALKAHQRERIAAHAPIQELTDLANQLQDAYSKIIAARQGRVEMTKDLSEAGINTETAAGLGAQTWAREQAMKAYDQIISQVGAKVFSPEEKQLMLRVLIGGGSPEDQKKWDEELMPKIQSVYQQKFGAAPTNVVTLTGKPLTQDQVASLSDSARAGLLSMVTNSPNASVPPMSESMRASATPGLLAFRQAGAAVSDQAAKSSVVSLLVWAAIGYFAWKYLFKKETA